MLTYQMDFRKEEEYGFTVTVPALPGCVSFGKTLEEAEEMANEAIELYLESMNDHGEKAPR
jgi:predicted RNase H-like HicB family nuclease